MSQKPQDKMSEIDEHITKRFDIKKRLGKGAYGIVWKAIDKKTGETIAVKKIFDAFRNQTDSQRTFREIMFLQSFRNHPNIIKLHSIHRAANNRDIYLGFEYMDTDLHIVIKRGNILRDCHKRFIMYQLFNATKYIHSGNVIHRDQKPSNVLLDQYCRCKIADFGLARSLTTISEGENSNSDPALTDYVATRWYRAPEILIASKRYTKGIDMWSLGCILGEMLAGKPIFPGTSTVNQVEKIMGTITPPTSEDIAMVCTGIGSSMIKNVTYAHKLPFTSILGTDCHEDALDLINKLLVFNPNKRLTADESLEHPYVATYRNKNLELSLTKSVIPPIDDDVRLSVSDYRNKLYELMSQNSSSRPMRVQSLKKFTSKGQSNISSPPKPESIKSRSSPVTHDVIYERQTKLLSEPRPPPRDIYEKPSKITTQIEKMSKSKPDIYEKPNRFGLTKEKTSIEFKSRLNDNKLKNMYSVKSESKLNCVPKSNILLHGSILPRTINVNRNSFSDFKTVISDQAKEKQKKKVLAKSSIYVAPFNSYSHTHGIITASALKELKSGVR